MKPMHAFIGTQVFVLSTKCICTYHGNLGILPLNLQGLPVLVGLIEDNVAESGKLTGMGVDCIWRVLEVHGTSPLNHLCRLLANAGLPNRLMRAMLTFNQEYQLLQTHAEVGLHSLLFSLLFIVDNLQCCATDSMRTLHACLITPTSMQNLMSALANGL